MNSQTKLSVFMLLALAYLMSPMVYGAWLFYELSVGAFPAEADSIGIPLAGFMVLWFAGLLFAGVVAITLVYKRVFLDKD